MSTTGMMAAVAKAAGIGEEQAEVQTIDAAFIAHHFGDVAAALREEGAAAEHERLIGIEAAAMPGHEAIIEAHKKDRSKTPADAALAVISAEKAKNASRRASLDDDENKLVGLRAASAETAAAGAGAGNPHVEAVAIAKRAEQYRNEQAAKGVVVSAAEAVVHVTKEQ